MWERGAWPWVTGSGYYSPGRYKCNTYSWTLPRCALSMSGHVGTCRPLKTYMDRTRIEKTKHVPLGHPRDFTKRLVIFDGGTLGAVWGVGSGTATRNSYSSFATLKFSFATQRSNLLATPSPSTTLSSAPHSPALHPFFGAPWEECTSFWEEGDVCLRLSLAGKLIYPVCSR
jgi:hypothetical protein